MFVENPCSPNGYTKLTFQAGHDKAFASTAPTFYLAVPTMGYRVCRSRSNTPVISSTKSRQEVLNIPRSVCDQMKGRQGQILG